MPTDVFRSCTDYAEVLIYTHRLKEIRELRRINYSLNLLKDTFTEDVIKKKILKSIVKDIH